MRFIKLLDIRPPEPERPIGLLSGGNQQKALLARWLATAPRLLILDEPTRGIDVGAHAEIIRLIRELCDDGLALLVISSELDEIVTYSDRVIVLRDRAHVAELEGRGHRRLQYSGGIAAAARTVRKPGKHEMPAAKPAATPWPCRRSSPCW
jgi:monosaccharide-transporting ATPase